MGKIPVVDLSKWLSGTPESQAAVASEFDRAVQEFGFAQLANHGIPPEVIAEFRSAAFEFFDLPAEEKRRAKTASAEAIRGYTGPGVESAGYSLSGDSGVPPSPPDLGESFVSGPDNLDYSDPFYSAQRSRLFCPNAWPENPPRFRLAANRYFAEVRRVAFALVDLLHQALDLPPKLLAPKFDRSTETLRVNHYPPRSAQDADAEPEGQMRMSAHTDFGILTLLLLDSVPGLEIYSETDGWTSIVPEADYLVCNVGDLAAQMTNDRWKSTLHRVVPGTSRRLSIAFFFDGNYDALWDCLPTCHDEKNPPKYPAVTAGEHLIAKIDSFRNRKPPTGRFLDTLNHRRAAF